MTDRVARARTRMRPKVLIVRPGAPAEPTVRLIGEVTTEARRLNLALTVLKSHATAVDPEWRRTPVQFLSPADAERIYRQLHQGGVLVVSFSAVYVRRDPRRNRPGEKHAIRLEDFVAHKARYLLVNGRTDVATIDEMVAEWPGTLDCQGRDDPRVLPLHSFDAGGACPELDSEAGREAFATRYGLGGLRVDASGRKWGRATPHGRDSLTVAGCQLPAGLHWDVGYRQGSGTLMCANAVWRLPRRGYANVYPDGGVRGGSTDTPSIKKIWPLKQ